MAGLGGRYDVGGSEGPRTRFGGAATLLDGSLATGGLVRFARASTRSGGSAGPKSSSESDCSSVGGAGADGPIVEAVGREGPIMIPTDSDPSEFGEEERESEFKSVKLEARSPS